jgi:hypothetical protein
MEGQQVKPTPAQESNGSASENPEKLNTAITPPIAMIPMPFRRLELEVPTDWSSTGVLAYTQHAQQVLQQALARFEHPAMAELEFQQLEPRIREYVRARHVFDTALMLQWASVYTGSASHPAVVHGTHLEQAQVRSHSVAAGSREPASSTSGSRDQLSNDDPDDPEPAHSANQKPRHEISEHLDQTKLLQQLEVFKRQERAWYEDRLMLKQEMILLELEKNRVVVNWTRVKQHFEALKSHLRKGDTIGPGVSRPIFPSDSGKTQQVSRKPSAQQTPVWPILRTVDPPHSVTTSSRISPPALSASMQANIERLSTSLIANLARLEGHCIRPRDIAHVTGETGPWKKVIEHLLNSGRIERVGEFITFSMVERLRRHLPAVNLETLTKKPNNKTAKRSVRKPVSGSSRRRRKP